MSTTLSRVQPRITVKALAEFATFQVHDHVRILEEQKHPRAAAAPFRGSYYQSARAAARGFYSAPNGSQFLSQRVTRVKGLPKMSPAQIGHNVRAMKAFARSSAFAGPLAVRPQSKYEQTWHGAKVSLRPDIEGVAADGRTKFILLHCDKSPIDAGLARRVLELSYQLLDDSGVVLDFEDCELFCLESGTVHRNPKRPRIPTVRRAEKDLKTIIRLWPAI